MGRRKPRLDELAKLKALAQSGILHSPSPNRLISDDAIESIDERVHRIFAMVNRKHRTAKQMLFFVMYDIESNKVRRYVVKYLEKKGCTRVQKSIFLADLSIDVYQTIRNDLTQVQAAYDNEDSILIVPITTDYLRAMKIIGQNIDIDIITHTKNTLFF